MRIAYFDCFSGASGDMILGALMDAGVDEAAVRSGLEELGVPGWSLDVSTTAKRGIRATRVLVTGEQGRGARPYREIVDIIRRSALDPRVAALSLATFDVLADAEARVHDSTKMDVHFHDVGSLDAVVDIVGACTAFHHLALDQVFTSPIPSGTGTAQSAHGPLPVPAPAVTEILARRGATLQLRDTVHELVTPTGAALLAAFTDAFSPPPGMRLTATGYGAGARDLEEPNVLRVLIGNTADRSALSTEEVVVETNIDDMSPELFPYILARLLSAGAQDAWITPIVMKKGRPAFTLSVLTSREHTERTADILLDETTTLGLRVVSVEKLFLERRSVEVDVDGHPVRMKFALREGRIVNASPEHDDARAVSEATGQPLKDVYRAARNAFERETVVEPSRSETQ